MDYDKRYGFSYLDGVPIRISSKFCPPRAVTLPIAVDAQFSTDLLSLEYDFSLERKVLQFELRCVEEQKAAYNDTSSKVEGVPKICNKENTSPKQLDSILKPNNQNILPLQHDIILQPKFQTPQCNSSNDKDVTKKINLSDFENDTSTPFDYMELQTINDLEELSNVFQGLTTNEPCIAKVQEENGSLADKSNNEVTVPKSISFPPSQKSDSEKIEHMPEAALSNNRLSLSYTNVMDFVNDYHSTEAKCASGISNYSALSQVPYVYSNISRHSLTEDQMMSGAKTVLRGSKSYSDLCNLPDYESRKILEDRPHTPSSEMCFSRAVGTPFAQAVKQVAEVKSIEYLNNQKPYEIENFEDNSLTNSPGLPDPYDELDDNARQVVNSIADMGFARGQVSRAVKHLGTDEKKVVEHLCQIQIFEESGYDNLEAEAALHLHDYNKDEAKAFLDLVKQFQDLGFEKNEVKKALVQNKNDWNKTIDSLLP